MIVHLQPMHCNERNQVVEQMFWVNAFRCILFAVPLFLPTTYSYAIESHSLLRVLDSASANMDSAFAMIDTVGAKN